MSLFPITFDFRPSVRDSDDEEARRMFQRRLALFTVVLFGIFVFATALDLLLGTLGTRPNQPSYALPQGAFLLALGHLAVSIRCRIGRPSRRTLRALDSATAILTCFVLVPLMMHAPSSIEASMGLALGTAYVLMARAVVVPSSGKRTFFLCLVAMSLPTAAAALFHIRDLGRPATADYLFETFAALRFAVITTVLATLASQVIYGLRRRVRESARVGQYVLREKIGEGGMGVVYRATHAMLRRDTAIKLLSPERISPAVLARFEREVVLTAQLSHPNTVSVYDYGRTPDGIFYYAMEHLPGGDLQELVAFGGPVPAGRVIFILEQVCRALREAHGLGLIHRDIKPSNILLCERGGEADVAKVVDFGLVKDLAAQADGAITTAGALTGTPQYMAPESVALQSADARTDLYSLGATAYFLLTGQPPFSGRSVVEVAAHHLHTVPEPPSSRGVTVPADLEATILRCLAKTPEERFAGAGELLAALERSSDRSAWDAAHAVEWWRTHRDAFREHCQRTRRERFTRAEELNVSSAIAVDLAERRPPPSTEIAKTRVEL